jgi:hypothetical protein
MIFKREHSVTFLSPGTFVSEATDKDIVSWDTREAVKMAESITERHGAKPYGFRFETWKTHTPVSDGEGGTLEVKPKLEKSSGIYFLGGKLETYDDVCKRNDPKEEILRSNMKYNEYWVVCINTNSYKSTLPFGEEDRIVDATGTVIEDGSDPKWVKYRAEQLAKRKAELGF